MTVEVLTRVVGGGKQHIVSFVLKGGTTVEQLLPIPVTRPGSRYHITGGTISGVAGSFFLCAGDSVHSIASVSIASPTVITTTADHGLTGTFNCLFKGKQSTVPGINNFVRIGTVTGAATFTIPINVTGAGVANTGEVIVEPVSLSSPLASSIGMVFLGTVGPTGQNITPLSLPAGKALILSADKEATQFVGNLVVEEMYPRS